MEDLEMKMMWSPILPQPIYTQDITNLVPDGKKNL